MTYHYVSYPSGSTYVFSEDRDTDGCLMIVVEVVVNKGNTVLSKKVGDRYYPPVDSNGNIHFNVPNTIWETGDKDYILGLVALEAL